jgi:hypothetical protein
VCVGSNEKVYTRWIACDFCWMSSNSWKVQFFEVLLNFKKIYSIGSRYGEAVPLDFTEETFLKLIFY